MILFNNCAKVLFFLNKQKIFIGVRENKCRENNNIEISFIFLLYFCLDTKVQKNQGKKKSAGSANHLSGSIKTRHFLLLSY